jgi:hypothetical protein
MRTGGGGGWEGVGGGGRVGGGGGGGGNVKGEQNDWQGMAVAYTRLFKVPDG